MTEFDYIFSLTIILLHFLKIRVWTHSLTNFQNWINIIYFLYMFYICGTCRDRFWPLLEVFVVEVFLQIYFDFLSLYPRILEQGFGTGSVILLEHLVYNFFEFRGHQRSMSLIPEFSCIFAEEMVVWIVLGRFCKWRFAYDQIIEDHTQREDIYFLTVVWQVFKNFWSHIGVCPKEAFKRLIWTVSCGKPKITHFDFVIIFKQYILQFDISMTYILWFYIWYEIENLIYDILGICFS